MAADDGQTDWPHATTAMVEYKTVEHGHPGDDCVFIQWKGTDVCFDFWCECGGGGHYDGYFAYEFTCPSCEQVFAMPSTIRPARLKESTRGGEPVRLDG